VLDGQQDHLLALGVVDLGHGFEPLAVDALGFDSSFEMHEVGLLYVFGGWFGFVELEVDEAESFVLGVVLLQLFFGLAVSHACCILNLYTTALIRVKGFIKRVQRMKIEG